MNSRTLRRLAADHSALHNQLLPPNYLFSPSSPDNDDLTQLDILLAGPTHTPFAAGVWKLHLTIPPTYPQQPPSAYFRTPIFHPNVDPQTGGVCVETLKQDWDSKLTLRDVLITISCLLIQPNPDSALNAEAGSLIQEDYSSFGRRAQLMTNIHASIPAALRADVEEAQQRGQEKTVDKQEQEMDVGSSEPAAPVRRRRPTARLRGTVASRRCDGSPTGGLGNRRTQAGPSRQLFVAQPVGDDVFKDSTAAADVLGPLLDDDGDSSMLDGNQENDATKSPVKAPAPRTTTPRRRQGNSHPAPLGELSLSDVSAHSSSDEDNEMEAEYPPSPRKSPAKRRQQHQQSLNTTATSSNSTATTSARPHGPNITPPTNLFSQPLAQNSPFSNTPSPRKTQRQQQQQQHQLTTPLLFGSRIQKPPSPSTSSEKKRAERERSAALDARLWELCGGDIRRWNRGEFDGDPFGAKARRW